MGSAYLVRKTLLEASDYARKLKEYDAAAAEARKKKAVPPAAPPRNLDLEPLVGLLDGKLTAFVECHRADDIRTALRLIDEFGFKAVLVGATEAYKSAAEIARRRVPVVVGIMGVGPKRVETKDVTLENAAALVAAGIKTAIAAEDALGLGAQEELPLSAALAVKGGLDRDAALRSVTLTAAEILGVASRVGSLEPGKDADIVVFSGDPLSYKSRVIRVFIDGRPVAMPEPLRPPVPLT
jgi:imidazolonepropionase-like amidohydrolase